MGLTADELHAETLFPGDIIEYYSMAFVAGDPRGHRAAKILKVCSDDADFPIRVDSQEMLPLTILIKRKLDRNQEQIPASDAKWRKLRTFKLVHGEVEGETRADRLNRGLKKSIAEAMKATKKSTMKGNIASFFTTASDQKRHSDFEDPPKRVEKRRELSSDTRCSQSQWTESVHPRHATSTAMRKRTEVGSNDHGAWSDFDTSPKKKRKSPRGKSAEREQKKNVSQYFARSAISSVEDEPDGRVQRVSLYASSKRKEEFSHRRQAEFQKRKKDREHHLHHRNALTTTSRREEHFNQRSFAKPPKRSLTSVDRQHHSHAPGKTKADVSTFFKEKKQPTKIRLQAYVDQIEEKQSALSTSLNEYIALDKQKAAAIASVTRPHDTKTSTKSKWHQNREAFRYNSKMHGRTSLDKWVSRGTRIQAPMEGRDQVTSKLQKN